MSCVIQFGTRIPVHGILVTDVYILPLKWTLLQLLVFHEMNEEDIAFLNGVSESFRVMLNTFSFPSIIIVSGNLYSSITPFFCFLNDNMCTHYNASSKLLERPIVIRDKSLI